MLNNPRLLRAFSRFRFIIKIAQVVSNRVGMMARAVDAYCDNRKRYTLLANAEVNCDSVGYEGDKEITTFLAYKSQLSDEARLKHSESEALYENQINVLSDILSAGNIKGVLNFGVCYAYVDSVLAERFPDIEFHGVDRSPYTKILNEHEFQDRKNMKFFAGDGFKLMQEGDYKDFALMHSRTAVVFPKPLVERLYGESKKAGISHIAGFEQTGISHETFSDYEFSDDDKDSVWYRGFMFIHNYPGLLIKSGYQPDRFDLLKTGHPHPDFRVCSFIAHMI